MLHWLMFFLFLCFEGGASGPGQMFFVLLVLGLSLCEGQRSVLQGDRKSCDRCDLTFSCNCSSAGLTCVPMVTERALSLDLSFNDIAVVTAEDLKDHERLRVLSLHCETQHHVGGGEPIRRADSRLCLQVTDWK